MLRLRLVVASGGEHDEDDDELDEVGNMFELLLSFFFSSSHLWSSV